MLVQQKAGDAFAQNTAKAGKHSTDNDRHYQWRMVTSWPKKFPGLGMAPEYFAEAVRRMSNGRLDIQVHGAGEIVPALGVFDAVSLGSVEMGHSAAYYWKGKIPAAQFFTAIPFGLNAQEMNAWLYYGGGLELWREVYEPYNLVPFPGGNTGVQMGGWFNREINSVADLQNLKMRIPGFGGEVLNRLGGTAVNIPGGEIFTALQTGVIDATEWVGPYNDLTFGLHQAAQYYYYPGWHEAGPTLEFTVNKKAWNSLPKDLQAIVEIAARATNQNMLDEYTARNNAALIELKEKHGVSVRAFPKDVLRELKKVSQQVLKEQVQSDAISKKVYENWSVFRKNVEQYHDVSEKAYYNAR
ncbi:MAG: TRAP transporter substrate-binding protein DctP [Pseudomonadales bacterium]|nr:TRAP transporter substrate-binding protein DctP [Pseudomonadales bacterium]